MKFLLIKIVVTLSLLASSQAARDWWERGNFYQIYPRSFMDSNGDGVGDLIGITQRLEHLKDIGMTGVWLSPIFKSPMADFGYDISNYTDIHYEYGTLDDFEALSKKSKELGIKLILDFVPNHTSDEHPWFKLSEKRDPYYENFYVWHPGKINNVTGEREPPSNWNSLFRFTAWQWSDIRQEYYLHQCIIKQPDLNYREPKVLQAMKEVLVFWLDKGVDGFRIDAIPYIFETIDEGGNFPDEPLSHECDDVYGTCYLDHIYTKDLPETYELVYSWHDLMEEYKQKHNTETKILMTEAYTTLKMKQLFYGNDEGRRGSQIPFNFELIDNLKLDSTPNDYKVIIDSWLETMPKDAGYVPNWVISNHDQHRAVDRLGPNRGDLLNIMVQTLPGIAITYYGEEIVMRDVFIGWNDTVDILACNQGPENFYVLSRDPARTPFQWDDTKNAGFSTADKTWLPVSPDYKENNLKKQLAAPKSHVKIFKSLIELRKKPVLQEGTFESQVDDNLLIYVREYLGKQVFVVLNLGQEDQYFNLSEKFPKSPKTVKISVASLNSNLNDGRLMRSNQNILIPKDAAAVFE